MSTDDETPVEELTAIQEQAAVLKALGKNDTEAAKKLGVSRTTLWRWKSTPAFARRLETLREEQLSAARKRLRELADDAARNIAGAVDEGDVSVSYRVAADLGLFDAPERPLPAPPDPPEDPEDLDAWLRWTLEGLASGAIDRKTARTISGILRAADQVSINRKLSAAIEDLEGRVSDLREGNDV